MPAVNKETTPYKANRLVMFHGAGLPESIRKSVYF